MSRKGTNLKRTLVIICFLLFAFRVGAQSSGTGTPACNDPQECADMAQQSANDALAKQNDALANLNDTQATLNTDVANGACDAQIQDDQNVLNAVSQDYANAQNAAIAAQTYANDAQTYADDDDLVSAQQAATNAAAQDTQA